MVSGSEEKLEQLLGLELGLDCKTNPANHSDNGYCNEMKTILILPSEFSQTLHRHLFAKMNVQLILIIAKPT